MYGTNCTKGSQLEKFSKKSAARNQIPAFQDRWWYRILLHYQTQIES
jgi:hypothetical protein